MAAVWRRGDHGSVLPALAPTHRHDQQPDTSVLPMAFVHLEDDEALKGHARFHLHFSQQGFGGVPDLGLWEPRPPYVEDPKPEHAKDQEPPQYVTGWKLFGLIMSITMACFLVLLDMSVIVTVCQPLLARALSTTC